MSKTETQPSLGMFSKYLDEISKIIEDHQGEFYLPSPLVGVQEIDRKLYYEHKIVSRAFDEIWRSLNTAKDSCEAQ